ncbi:MAG: sigma-54-dependent Fis family transcriptional regulator, partial [Pseudomonadota bacterium]
MPTRQSRLLLLIDDDPAQGRLVSALAAREGWRTQIVATGSDALALLAAPEGEEVTAVLLDQRVPG